jgi:hypothetical protein
VLDGVYRCGADGAPTFIEAAASTDQELHALLLTVIARFMKMLTRRGVLVEEMGQTWLAELDTDGEEARTVWPLQAAGRLRQSSDDLAFCKQSTDIAEF